MNKPVWKIRRTVVICVLFFCAFCVLWIMFDNKDRSIYEVIVVSSFGLAFSTIGSYIFGAVWDDANVMKEIGPKAYEKDPPPIDGPQV